MAKKKAKRVGVSRKKLSRKVAIVRREDPSLIAEQATGKAAGIIRHERKKKRRK